MTYERGSGIRCGAAQGGVSIQQVYLLTSTVCPAREGHTKFYHSNLSNTNEAVLKPAAPTSLSYFWLMFGQQTLKQSHHRDRKNAAVRRGEISSPERGEKLMRIV